VGEWYLPSTTHPTLPLTDFPPLSRSFSTDSRPPATGRVARASGAGAASRLIAVLAVALIAISLLAPRALAAQRVDPPPRLGLGASSAFGVYAGAGVIPHASLGPNVGGTLDLGWIASRRVRFSVGVDYLATTIDRVDSLGVRQTGKGYVFSALADVNLMGPITRRITPYVGGGAGVNAVGTTIQNEHIGAIYNTNVFDVHAQIGALVRVAPRGRLSVELRGTGARVVRRFGVRVGYTWLYNELR
jgi:hypothetical protein